MLRAQRATFSAHVGSLNGDLTPEELRDIRARSIALLRRADACGLIPTPLEQLLDVAQLVASGEITLDEEEKRRLRKRFGSLVDLALGKFLGAVHFKAREVWVQPDLYLPKKRFATAHEIGHDLLPWQRDSITYLDDDQRLRQDVRLTYERQANQVAIELLAHGDLLRAEADDSALMIDAIIELANRYQISLVATARRVVEETRKEAALTIRFCSNGRTGPSHLYSLGDVCAAFLRAATTLGPDSGSIGRSGLVSVFVSFVVVRGGLVTLADGRVEHVADADDRA